MNPETLREYCMAKPGVTESLPFGPETVVFKVGGKIFALMGLDNQPLSLNLKCDPERAVQLRDEFAAVRPGYHMNKRHWNTVVFDGSLRWADVQAWIDHSYELVSQSLPKAVQQQLKKAIELS